MPYTGRPKVLILEAKQTLSITMEMSLYSLEEFFCRKGNREILFADQSKNSIRCRLGLFIRNIWISTCGFVSAYPLNENYIFAIAPSRVKDFGVAYITSSTREINPEITGHIVCTDVLEVNGVYYYTVIYEKNNKPRLPERVNWEC